MTGITGFIKDLVAAAADSFSKIEASHSEQNRYPPIL